MPNWKEIVDEIKNAGNPFDKVRRKYLKKLSVATGRNVIAYYSAWLQKGALQRQGVPFGLDDNDKMGFMTAIHRLDRDKGLDLLLHTPGGEAGATESLVDYLRSTFGNDIRAVVPQIAMSAGTMVSLSCKEILMGKHSSLGPIDPQIGGVPAHGIIEEFNRAVEAVERNPANIEIWRPIIAKYHPTLIGSCEKAIAWSTEMVREWLETGMFQGDPDGSAKAERIVDELGSHSLTKSYNRHISINKARELGIKVVAIEDNDAVQDLILSVHHAFIQTVTNSSTFKIIENQNGVAFTQQAGSIGT